MSDYGIIATEAGTDVDHAPDYRRTIDSRWPVLEILYEQAVSQDVSVAAGATMSIVLYNHKLGYAPAYAYMDAQGFDPTHTGYPTPDLVGFTTYFITADTANIYVSVTNLSISTVSFTARGFLRLFSYDPSKDFTADTFSSSDAAHSSALYGIAALTKPGSISDTEYSEFSINTKAKSLTIHKSGIADASSGSFVIEHNLGYQPSYLIFTVVGDGSISAGIPARSFGDTKTLSFFGVQTTLSGKYSYIIFKDPILEQA